MFLSCFRWSVPDVPSLVCSWCSCSSPAFVGLFLMFLRFLMFLSCLRWSVPDVPNVPAATLLPPFLMFHYLPFLMFHYLLPSYVLLPSCRHWTVPDVPNVPAATLLPSLGCYPPAFVGLLPSCLRWSVPDVPNVPIYPPATVPDVPLSATLLPPLVCSWCSCCYPPAAVGLFLMFHYLLPSCCRWTDPAAVCLFLMFLRTAATVLMFHHLLPSCCPLPSCSC